MLKNAHIYRVPKNWNITAAQLIEFTAPQAFVPCASLETESSGWISPRPNADLVHAVNGQFLLRLQTEKKLLPSSVINKVAKDRAAELAEQQGFPPGKKKFKEIKEQVTDELLPRAFTVASAFYVWIDPVNGWLVVDSTSNLKAEFALIMLLKAIPKFPLESFRTVMSPQGAMTTWLATDEAPSQFTIDRDADLESKSEGRSKVKFVRHTLEPSDIRNHIESGKQCTRLAMTWADKISFTLTDGLTLRKITPLDVLKESADTTLHHQDEKFDGEFALMTGELNALLNALTDALGGELKQD
jgi:recombination associated protein RdgC